MAEEAFDIFKALEAVPDAAETPSETPTEPSMGATDTAEPTMTEGQPATTEGAAAPAFDVFKALDAVPDQVETSPMTPPEPTPGMVDPNMIFIGPQPVPKVVLDAAESGVEWESPAPTGHFLSSLAYDSEHAKKAYETALKDHYGRDIPVRVNKGGELEYLNPETNRYALVSPPGAVGPKIEALGGPAIAFGPEMFAGTAAAIFTRNPQIVVGAGGGGAFLGELARLQLGREMGINDDVKDSDIINSAAMAAGISIVGGEVGNALFRVGRVMLNMMSGKPLSKEAVDELGLTMAESMEIQKKVNEQIRTQKLRFDLGQATNDETYLQYGEYFRKTPGYRQSFREFDENAQAALREFYDTINKPWRSRKSTGEAMGDAQNVLKAQIGRQEAKQNYLVEMKAMELREAQRSLESKPYESLGSPLRDAADKEVIAFREEADKGAALLHDLSGGKPFIQNKETFAAVKDMDRDVSESLFPSIQKPNRSLIGFEDKVVEEVPEDIRFLRESIGVAVDADALANIKNVIFDPKAKFTFKQAWNALRDLKAISRVSSKGLSTETPSVGQVNRLIGALESDLRRSAQGSPLVNQYNEFIEKYAKEKLRLDMGSVGNMMTREGGKNGPFVIADEKLFKTFFTPGTNKEAKELFSLIKDNPEQMQAMRESIVDFYKRDVLDGGRVDLTKHDQWVDRYSRAASVFFDKGEMKSLMRPGSIENALLAREAARDKALKVINSTFEGELASLNDPQRLLRIAMDPNDSSKMGRLVDALSGGKTQDVLRGVQTAFKREMSERIMGVFKGEGRLLSAPKLNDFLYGKSGEKGMLPVIRELYGEQYAKDLQTLDSALKIAAREGVATNKSNTAYSARMLKAVTYFFFRPLSQESRRFTTALMVKKATAEKVLYRAMMNPENLHEFLQMGDKRLGEQSVGALLGQLGGSALLNDLSPEIEE